VPSKAAPSHSLLKYAPVTGEGHQCVKSLQAGTLQLEAVSVYRRNQYRRIQHWGKRCSVTTALRNEAPVLSGVLRDRMGETVASTRDSSQKSK